MAILNPRAKLIFSLVLVGLGLLIILQNTQSVETRILFMTITMPRAALLFVTLLIGFCLGALTVWRADKRKS